MEIQFWIKLVILLFALNLSVVVMMQRRRPSDAWAWILVLVFVPVMGILLYYLFGFPAKDRPLISDERYARVQEKYETVRREITRLEKTGLPESDSLNAFLTGMGTTPVKGSVRLGDLLRRPGITYDALSPFDPSRPSVSPEISEEVEIQVKYAGYIQRQLRQIEQFQKEESRELPPDIDYQQITGLRLEARQKLDAIRPMNLGQASRVSGVSPADMAVLMIYLELREKEKQ